MPVCCSGTEGPWWHPCPPVRGMTSCLEAGGGQDPQMAEWDGKKGFYPLGSWICSGKARSPKLKVRRHRYISEKTPPRFWRTRKHKTSACDIFSQRQSSERGFGRLFIQVASDHPPRPQSFIWTHTDSPPMQAYYESACISLFLFLAFPSHVDYCISSVTCSKYIPSFCTY